MLGSRMLPFALSRFIAAHFDAPKTEPEASVRWKKLHGHSLSLGLQSYIALGGVNGHGFTPQVDEANAARAKSRTPFEDALHAAQKERSQLPLLEPFVGTLGLGNAESGEPYFAVVSVRSERAPVVGWNAGTNALDRVCADDVTSFAALNFISEAVMARRQNPAGRALKPLISALDDRVAFPEPYAPLEARFAVGDVFPVEWLPQPPPNRFYLRSAYLMEALCSGAFSLDAWAEFEQPAPDPTKALKNIPRSAPTALYWMWRLFIEGHDEAAATVVEAAKRSKASWVIDAGRVVGELLAGRNELGTIDDVAALREHIGATVRDPMVLVARKARQRRPTVDKRVAATRVPSGLRFEVVDQVPPAPAPGPAELVAVRDRGLELRRDGTTRLLLPPEAGSAFLDSIHLDRDHIVVLSETPGEKATRRRVTLYKIGSRVMRLGGHVFQDVMGDSGLVRVKDNAMALWKEAVEQERMFPWTGRTTLYGFIEGNLVSLGGASYDCTGARMVGGELYALRGDGSGYRATGIDDALSNQAAHHAGPRFAPIPMTECEPDDSARDVFSPGPVTVDGELLRWKYGPLPRTAPCPPHLRDELGVSISRDGKTAWLMSRTGDRIDQLDLTTGKLSVLCMWPESEGWPVGVAEAGNDLVVASTWRIRVLRRKNLALLWSKDVDEVQSLAGLPSRHFAVLSRGNSGPGILTIHYVRDLEEAPENESDAAGDWSSYGYAGEEMFLYSAADAIVIAGTKTRGQLDPAILDNVPHWARSRGWFPDPAKEDDT